MVTALVRRFAAELGLDPYAIVTWIEGTHPIPEELARLLHTALGVPLTAWKRVAAPIAAPTVSTATVAVSPVLRDAEKAPPVAISHPPVQDRNGMHPDHFYLLGMGSRRQDHPIFAWLVERRKNTAWLAAEVETRIGRKISRSTLQTYIAGEQASRRYGKRPVTMPGDVAAAIEQITEGAVKATDFVHAAKP